MASANREPNQGVEWFLCLILGYLGVHKFYAGKKAAGLLYLFTAGLFGLGWILDLIILSVRLFTKPKVSAQASVLPEKRTLTEEDFRAVGVSYYETNIRKLACQNPDWGKTAAQLLKAGKGDKRIFKDNYVNRPVKLVIEPDNPHDPNAVAVMVAGELVGYISREDNARVREILNSREVVNLSAFIGGGDYKIIQEDGETIRDSYGFSVKIWIKYI